MPRNNHAPRCRNPKICQSNAYLEVNPNRKKCTKYTDLASNTSNPTAASESASKNCLDLDPQKYQGSNSGSILGMSFFTRIEFKVRSTTLGQPWQFRVQRTPQGLPGERTPPARGTDPGLRNSKPQGVKREHSQAAVATHARRALEPDS